MKEKSGTLLHPYFMSENEAKVKTENEDNSALAAQTIKLKEELFVLQKNHNEVVNDCANVHETIRALRIQLRETKNVKNEVYVTEIESLKEKIKVNKTLSNLKMQRKLQGKGLLE